MSSKLGTLLRITTTYQPATDLGYLLHKNPGRVHRAEMPYGKATVVFPEATESVCSAALVLDVDSVGLARKPDALWNEYVNDRPYTASSFVSQALLEFFSTAMSGRCKDRPELAEVAIPLTVSIPVIKVRGGIPFLRTVFEPLGYTMEARPIELDPTFPAWGSSSYFSLELSGAFRLRDLLTHLYVLIPVLDDDKHYWVNKDEIEKLLRRGGEWLQAHPAREEITRRYLRHERILTREALARLAEGDGDPNPDEREEAADAQLREAEKRISLHDMRLDAVVAAILAAGAQRVLDLGCGEGRLIQRLIKEAQVQEILGVDVALSTLEKVKRRLRWDQLSEARKAKLKLIHGSLTYRDTEWEGYDAAALVEVIEHLDAGRLEALERVVFECARPTSVFVTTPNREYNDLFPGLAPGTLRHPDHRFEWTRAEFTKWAQGVADRFGYRVTFQPLGPEDPERGAPSQMAVFVR